MARVLCVGTIVYDQVFWVREISSRPVKVLADRHRTSGGGMAATAAVAIAALGGESIYWGRVGDDVEGTALCGWLAAAGVDTAAIRRVPGGRTGTSAMLVDPTGERLLAAYPGSDLSEDASWLPLNSVAGADAVLCDVRWAEGALAALAAARHAHIPTVVDADLAPRESLRALLKLSDHAIFSERCLLDFAVSEDRHAALFRAAEETNAQLGVTVGEEGVNFSCPAASSASLPMLCRCARDQRRRRRLPRRLRAVGRRRQVSARGCRLRQRRRGGQCSLGEAWAGMPNRAAVNDLMTGRHR